MMHFLNEVQIPTHSEGVFEFLRMIRYQLFFTLSLTPSLVRGEVVPASISSSKVQNEHFQIGFRRPTSFFYRNIEF